MYIKLNQKKKFSPFGSCLMSVIWDSVLNALLQTALDEILIAVSQYLMLIGTSVRSCVASRWVTVCALMSGRNRMGGRGLNSSGSGYGQVAVSCVPILNLQVP